MDNNEQNKEVGVPQSTASEAHPSDYQPGVRPDMNTVPPINETSSSSTPPTPPPPETPKKGSMGAIFGIIIIIVLIILAGFYFWGAQLKEQISTNQDTGEQTEMTAEEIASQRDTSREALENQSTSDELPNIEADLDRTSLENLDQELTDIDAVF